MMKSRVQSVYSVKIELFLGREFSCYQSMHNHKFQYLGQILIAFCGMFGKSTFSVISHLNVKSKEVYSTRWNKSSLLSIAANQWKFISCCFSCLPKIWRWYWENSSIGECVFAHGMSSISQYPMQTIIVYTINNFSSIIKSLMYMDNSILLKLKQGTVSCCPLWSVTAVLIGLQFTTSR